MERKPPAMPGRRCTWRAYLTAYEAHQISECTTGRYVLHVGSAVDRWLSEVSNDAGTAWGREIGGIWECDDGLWSILGTPLDEEIGAREGDAPIPGERPICETIVRDDDGQTELPAGPVDDSDLTMGEPQS